MSEPFTAVKVTDNVYWVGAIDWSLREFHGYATERGSTYNAYLIMADKITLIDCVKAPFHEEMMSRIASVVEPSRIDYIVSNHAEMDHSGCLPKVIEQVSPEKVFASSQGVKALQAHFHWDVEITAIQENQPLSLGNLTLQFLETRLLHWPDSMFSFLVEEGILFSQDGFGMHLASSQRFSDELDLTILEHEAAKYYANILLPFSPMIVNALKKAAALPIKMIAPDHGPIWREGVSRVVDLYAKWAAQAPTAKAMVLYDTMWESTDHMASAVADGLSREGIAVQLLRVRETHRSNVATELLGAGALLVGSPTINGGLYPTVADVMTYLKGLRPKNLVGAAFGSYGWSGEAAPIVQELLTGMRVEVVAEPVTVQYVPDKEALVRCRELGSAVAAALKQKLA